MCTQKASLSNVLPKVSYYLLYNCLTASVSKLFVQPFVAIAEYNYYGKGTNEPLILFELSITLSQYGRIISQQQ